VAALIGEAIDQPHLTTMEKNPMDAEREKLSKLFDELINAPKQNFPRSRERLKAPPDKGVYVIYNPEGKPAHVGSTPRGKGGIHQRLRDHLAGRSSFTVKYLDRHPEKLREGYEFCCIIVPDGRLRALLEAYAIGQFCPAHIGLTSGEEAAQI
jgi:hypothetical protein